VRKIQVNDATKAVWPELMAVEVGYRATYFVGPAVAAGDSTDETDAGARTRCVQFGSPACLGKRRALDAGDEDSIVGISRIHSSWKNVSSLAGKRLYKNKHRPQSNSGRPATFQKLAGAGAFVQVSLIP
jgi:hypothetical protein